MPDDYMNMGGPGGGEEMTPEAPEEGDTEEEAEGSSALIPKALLPEGYKVGDTVTFKIVHDYEDEVEVAKVSTEPAETPESPMSADEEIDSMAQEG